MAIKLVNGRNIFQLRTNRIEQFLIRLALAAAGAIEPPCELSVFVYTFILKNCVCDT